MPTAPVWRARDATDEAPEDDLVLEHEQDDADAPGLIDPESTESDEH